MIILDGGMGRHLKTIGAPFGQPEWSALSLIEDPSYVTLAHNDFINAGAEYITTNSYGIVPFHIGEERFNKDAENLLILAGKLAFDAKAASQSKVKVAAGIPPVFGSYKPDAFNSKAAVPILELFRDCLLEFSDIIIGETLSSIDELKTVQGVFADCKKPIWLSLTLIDDDNDSDLVTPKLRSGELVQDALKAIDFNIVDAVLFNCSQPEVMASAITMAVNNCKKETLVGVYANAFPSINSSQKSANNQIRTIRPDLDPLSYKEFAKKWLQLGATIIGGCCGIGPDHIAELRSLKKEI
jgi:S-methylmethionine-dependent homocysteine/selenocysteine methylase|tara:strand:+ start:1058 stop:1951 length:894 start_codon:yes stop_codon:yes gene_type:complete